MRTPSDLRRRRIDIAREKSSIKTPSVISSSSRPASNPVSIRVSWASRTMSSLRNCTGDRLTEICSRFGQDAASRHAARRIHSPIATISPLSSGSGMKLPGATHQRLEPDDLAVDPGQRLKIEPQFVVGEGRLKIMLQFAAIAQLRRHVGLEERDRIAPFGLGAVERHIRVGEKDRRVGAVDRTGCDADAQSDAQLSSGDLDVAAQRRLELQSELADG